MATDDRDILEVLKEELSFVEKGGYGRSVKTPWQPTSVFKDSRSCLNYGYPYRAHPCGECQLVDFVPDEARASYLPCHHIPLNEAGETIETLEMEDNQALMEETVKEWLRARIKEIEARRAAQAIV